MLLHQSVLETMIAKANDIYNRWSNGQEVPTIVLRHTDEFPEAEGSYISSDSSYDSGYSSAASNSSHASTPAPSNDSFNYTHRSLAQCIVEVHQRARFLFPMRKPCNCSQAVAVSCPPSHSWSPPPNISQASPVLPDLYSSSLPCRLLPADGPAIPQPLSPTSKMSMVHTLNFELGALNPSSDQSWMAWF